ncbi:RNA polymerase factor sigma-54 [Pantoea sp. Aalb]|uniref:RNA polymerase factor sigma-54 n=1 Tax=Pantoea sp. Aalb TaxID=2576762 RepID=UPI00132A8A80|nr:RNA polymerase factor sigma-54 [Pantoea sp. Aalb]MXP67813.1 RNA polymerase factor sigma-54 [Pantoea sp. Aalb]
MKQSFKLKFNQQLVITPQLQQAIRLLQLSMPELHHELQLALEKNPLLEQNEQSNELEEYRLKKKYLLEENKIFEQKISLDTLFIDSDWKEIYTANISSNIYTSYNNYDDELIVPQGKTSQSLQDYLMWQVELTPFNDIERAIATLIIDAIDNSGYLTVTLQEIHDIIGNNKELTIEEIEIVLKRIQLFDPVGVGARDLRDCLLVQLSQYNSNVPILKEARRIVSDNLHLLANHDFRRLMHVTQLKEDMLKNVMIVIQSLDPRPGQSINTDEPEYIIPDVIVQKISSHWIVKLNTDHLPNLKINTYYAAMIHNNNCQQFIRDNLQEAQWLIKSLENRNTTLLIVTNYIVKQQQAFFEQGEEYMRPMILKDIAQALNMHESTISRVTTNKYLYSPRGIFELKYFFSSHINTQNGCQTSSIAIRALVKRLISIENPIEPLSDSKITSLLSEQGIIIARRTVAKYRESLFIPPSSQRKKIL